MQLAHNILQLFLLTPGHVRLYANLFFMVDTVNQRNLIFYLSLSGKQSSGCFTADSEQGRHGYLCVPQCRVSQHLERRRMVPTSERMCNAVAKLNDLLNFDEFDLPY